MDVRRFLENLLRSDLSLLLRLISFRPHRPLTICVHVTQPLAISQNVLNNFKYLNATHDQIRKEIILHDILI